MNDTLLHTVTPRDKTPASRRRAKAPRRDFIDILREEIAKGEYMTPERISRTVDILAPIVAQELAERGAA
ncbi:MAG TPA: hypothetical protein P5081_09530 [Phycisphaerae bacterium]|nr:hypothetical protein [Phycisphaerae bacterium]HRW53116.1 hypothetical protein [Phycisphaerae bacterium]